MFWQFAIYLASCHLFFATFKLLLQVVWICQKNEFPTFYPQIFVNSIKTINVIPQIVDFHVLKRKRWSINGFIRQFLRHSFEKILTIMSTDDRNFRSAYYEKVGCRSVEERKSLEILLKEKPLNRSKLKQFCLSYTVPAVYRNLLWNILLGKLQSMVIGLIICSFI